MKRLAMLLFCFSVVSGMAQSWFPNGAEWYYRFIPAGIAAEGNVRIRCDRDTIIMGAPSQVLEVFQTLGSVSPPFESTTEQLNDLFVTEQDGLVLLYNTEDELFDTLYHMAAAPGSSWGFPDMADWMDCGTASSYTVVDTGTVVMDAIPLRWLAVQLHYLSPDLEGPEYSRHDTIIERIGGLHSYFYPQDECNSWFDGNIGGPLTCYFDEDLSYGPGTSTDLACAYLANTIADEQKQPFQVFPNPTSGTIHVELIPGHGSLQLELLDISGRSLDMWQVRASTALSELDVSTIADGQYLLRAKGTSSARSTVILIKH